MAPAVSAFDHAMKMYVPFASSAFLANGVKSDVDVGTLIVSNMAPLGPINAVAAAMFPSPNAFSSTKRTTFLPLIGLMPERGAKS